MRIVRRGQGPPAERIPGGYRLDAEPDWIVEGSPEALVAVCAAMPPGIAEAWGPIVRLRFGNAVGRIAAGPLGTLHVHSGKWDESAYDAMLAEIAAEAAALPFAAGAASALPFARDPTMPHVDVPYHAFVWLRHALVEAPARPLLGALEQIVADPHRRLVRSDREVAVELASVITARALDDVLAGRWPFQRAPEGLGVRGVMPTRVADAAAREAVDTAENRFVKAFLDTCVRVIAALRERLSEATPRVAARLGADLDAVETALAPIRRASLWRKVGRLVQMPSGSAVLQRRAAYREVLRSSILLRAASRVLPLSEPDVVQLLEVRDIAKLYELWCGFHLLGLLRESLGQPIETRPLGGNAFGTSIRHGWQARWASGVESAVNPTYTQTLGWHGRSRSVELRPDFAVLVPAGPAKGLHLFDAKFRLAIKNGASESRVDDLHKMHTYRDAIPAARSAWVLYPGEVSEIFPDDPGASTVLGVGAFPALPGAPHDSLADHLADLLGVPRRVGRKRAEPAGGSGHPVGDTARRPAVSGDPAPPDATTS